MEINKDEAIKSISIAEKKISENDYVGAKKFVNKAQNLYPKLDGLKQVSMMIDVYISALDKINRKGEADWYGVLSVDPLVKDEDLKRQYKKLALLLHPDKNKFTGATEAFKLISEAWCVLSDKAQRFAYDLKRKSTDIESGICNTYCQFGIDSAYLNGTLSCPNCRQDFVATEIELEVIEGRRVIRFNKIRTDASSSNTSASDRIFFKEDIGEYALCYRDTL
ncbi:unnamed protein product [Eruca vesicaria subsp. sativa]|uniref:J domain-containing protein n=1 Tax=Eruca vesicaria subsp. sativa TaxID=29727 RepID=A0ABC8L5X9_ERUVS|nr:unnamed protein product [Eruca vesicaria subsp. sativa]